MRKKFILNLIILIGLNLLIKPFWVLGIDRTVQNTVGAVEYGTYISLFNLALLFHFLLDLGLNTYNNKSVAQDNNFLSKNFTSIIGIKFSLAIVYALISLLAATILDYNLAQIKLLFFLIINQFLISYTYYQRSNISGMHLFWADSIFSVMDKSIMIILSGLLIWGDLFSFSLEYFVYSQSIAYLFTAIISTLFVLSKSKIYWIKINTKDWIKVLKSSFPYALLILLMTVYTRSDMVLLQQLLTDGNLHAGIYAQSFRLLDAAAMFSLLFATWLLPIFSQMIKNKENLSSMVNLSFFSLMIFATIASISLYTFRFEIISILYNSYIKESSEILSVLTFSFIAISSNYIFGTLLTAGGKLKLLIKLAFLGVVINMFLNFVLIPDYKGLGSAIAALAAQTIVAIFQIYFAIKLYNIQLNMLKVRRFFIFILFILLLSYFVYLLAWHWIINFSIFVVISLSISFVIGILKIKSLREVLNENTRK